MHTWDASGSYKSLFLALLLAAGSSSSVFCGQVVEEAVRVGRPLLLPLGDHVRERGGSVLKGRSKDHDLGINRLRNFKGYLKTSWLKSGSIRPQI